ncbi:MAG TPA: 5-oxoprolinase subunit PxpB [Burkholderiales bacterium]|nr:5-oxoprolinase subunit PxpB [Burkholderiales bacterium]
MARLPKPLGVVPLGDLAAYVEFSRTLDLEVNSVAQRLAAAIVARADPRIRDVVPALGGVALHFDPICEDDVLKAATELVEQCMKKGLPDADDLGRGVEVPICYDAEFALDLADLAQRLKISPEEIIKRHADAEYRVLMVGFAPGHPYIGGLDPKLAVPRRSEPRVVVPAGSVAIANQQTVVYPYSMPGGWSVIGRTPLTSFDAGRPQPSLFSAGDRVRFRPIDKRDFLSLRERQ